METLTWFLTYAQVRELYESCADMPAHMRQLFSLAVAAGDLSPECVEFTVSSEDVKWIGELGVGALGNAPSNRGHGNWAVRS